MRRQGQAAQRLWFLHTNIHSLPEHPATVSSQAIRQSSEYCATALRATAPMLPAPVLRRESDHARPIVDELGPHAQGFGPGCPIS
jgi:hypothetical protein